MAHHESDSSDDDTQDFSTTNALLGYASTEPTDDTISQLGGRPVCSAKLSASKICIDRKTRHGWIMQDRLRPNLSGVKFATV